MDLQDIVLWTGGIIVSVLLAFLGIKKVRKSHTQAVKADNGATVIQSGRDTKIG